jgi:hypothetical protein
MVANNIPAPAPAIAPIDNPLVEEGAIDRYDQLFQMRIQVGAQLDDAVDIFLFGYFDVEQDEIVVQMGRGHDAAYGRVSTQVTLGQFIREGGVEAAIRFTEAIWCGWGDKEDAPALILNNAEAILAMQLGTLHREGLAASFDAVVVQPVVQA